VKSSRSIWKWISIAIVVEVLILFVIPVAIDLKIPLSPKTCPPPISHVRSVWIGSLRVTVTNMNMRLEGYKVLKPFIEILESSNRSVRLWLGSFHTNTVSITGFSTVVKNFVGPMSFNVVLGENSSGIMLPPTEVYYDPEDEAYVFQYYYLGLPTVATIMVKPMYRTAIEKFNVSRSVEARVYLCIGKSCWLGAEKLCTKGLCLLEINSSKPFQYTSISVAYRCGLLGVIFTSNGKLVLSSRLSVPLLALVTAVVVAATVCMGIVKTKRFK